MTGPVLDIRDLGIAFGGLKAVDRVSFSAERNRITTVIGPNGAGKSTLFNLISGALKPRSGQLLIDGVDMTGASPSRTKAAGLSRSFQITNLFFELTVAENLRMAAQVLEPNARAFLPIGRSTRALAKTGEMLERFQLGHKRDELAGDLSHGDQRRLEIAVCLASEPKILLLDEPTQGMSHADTADTAKLVRELSRDVSVLLIEHDIGLVMDLSDHVVVMHQGRKLAEGPPAVVRADPAVQAAYFGHH
ncbi:High-affinity branched-chain amino acid transport ATP-binding protein BraF [Bosea sp. 62]|uniref:ABC transporter ATP-binding protein n=1 Tax=unclassified Bosea (in: a-proteobacteria) TaxID=2653178 RepID=UPI0012569513|nr:MULTISPECIES: ABC transporter ATP-binding protein [unclassified Bosea (in: a-proteobacteria)]CAD5251553.1 High-affinity branched-chain amino acid transport ATP-binding protein BraF [Bosea sp. 7B]CAD5280376.1 High-affinity branched-chain amino acid transport ATP-binding protein BraF [Bosea sp. 21B]CAD5281479.1 High-affinity branched-chain amino acid transport ATP-binding protein BraF [Bosea sp. 46]VVT59437.1 High-affinity branched-chain amino acid transport ATP-binding protein BraF [Bosea sp.